MNWLGKIVFCLASGVALSGFCAKTGASDNPYEPIVTRNIFDLNPPKAFTPPPAQPPVKITPDGIMTIFGTKQVLFYADFPPRPPMPAAKKSYILSEGQQQDDIEVTRIDEKSGIITFNNHGEVQEIPLAKAQPISTPTPVVMNTARALPPVPLNNFGHRPGEAPPGMASRFNQNQPVGNAPANSGNPGYTPGYGGGNYSNAGNTQNQQRLSPEEQMIMIAAQHAQYQKEGNPIAKIFPPTELDQAAGVIPNNGSSSSGSNP